MPQAPASGKHSSCRSVQRRRPLLQLGGGAMTDQDHIAYGTPEACREFIEEMLAMAQIQARLGRIYAESGDDMGLLSAVRRFLAYARAVTDTATDLAQMTGGRRE